MHEVGIAGDLVKMIRQKLQNITVEGKIKKIFIQLGESTGVTEESLRFWFNNFSKGTELEEANLDISLVAGRGIDVGHLEME